MYVTVCASMGLLYKHKNNCKSNLQKEVSYLLHRYCWILRKSMHVELRHVRAPLWQLVTEICCWKQQELSCYSKSCLVSKKLLGKGKNRFGCLLWKNGDVVEILKEQFWTSSWSKPCSASSVAIRVLTKPSYPSSVRRVQRLAVWSYTNDNNLPLHCQRLEV